MVFEMGTKLQFTVDLNKWYPHAIIKYLNIHYSQCNTQSSEQSYTKHEQSIVINKIIHKAVNNPIKISNHVDWIREISDQAPMRSLRRQIQKLNGITLNKTSWLKM
jgi:hypothetical protein